MSAGFIFSYGITENNHSKIKDEINNLFQEGCFGTRNAKIDSKLTILCDYLSMKPGDNIYFLSHRKIYGIGTLVVNKDRFTMGENVLDCVFWASDKAKKNFKDGTIVQEIESTNTETEPPTDNTETEPPTEENTKTKEEKNKKKKKKNIIDIYGDNNDPADSNIHFAFTFTYDSIFYNGENKEPVVADMDDVLKYKPSSFRSLRFFSKKSFIKIDDEENEALKESATESS